MKPKNLDTFLLVIGILLILSAALCFTGCANRQAWTQTVVKDELKKITTLTVMYESDTGFTLGSQGKGEYSLIKVAPSAIDQ